METGSVLDTISVLVADCNTAKRNNLSTTITECSDLKLLAEVSDGPSAVKISENHAPDVVVINTNVTGFNGLIATKLIKSRTKSKVLLLGSDEPEPGIIQILSAGVDGYCTQSREKQILLSAIRSVAAGNLWIDDKVASKVVNILGASDPKVTSRHARLNDTEFKIFKMLAEGKDMWSICEELNINEANIQDYSARILTKLSLGEETKQLFRNIESLEDKSEIEYSKKCNQCKSKYSMDKDTCPLDSSELMVDPLLGTVFAEKYEILALEGTGATGSVYKAKHKYLGNYLAVKVLHSDLMADISFLHRLRQEAAAIMRLNHRSIVRVHDFGITKSGNAYMVMDYFVGSSLQSHIDEFGPLEPKKAVNIFMALADAFDYANKNGIIHRDIKPSNVLLANEISVAPKVLIVDFGTAKIYGHNNSIAKSLHGDIFGTPLYMSPEQCLGQQLDYRSDIYSLGCLMYETLSGRPPLVADTAIDVMHKQTSEEPINLKFLNTPYEIPSLLCGIVMKAIRKDKQKRFTSMSELKTYLAGTVF